MTQEIHNTAANIREDSQDFIKRTVVLVYGILAYTIGVTGLMWIILAMGGLAPVGLSAWQADSLYSAILVDIYLIALFGIQHSVMARPVFKKWLQRYVPQATERATYLLMSGVVTFIALYFWQPLPGNVWLVEQQIAKVMLWSMYVMAWAYLFVATFVTNHFELMGLRQVYLYFRNKPYTSLPFTRKYMYSYSRHPMMLGFLVGMWSIPVMSISHFVMSSLFTLYIIIGIYLEERDLIANFGDTYRHYKLEIAAFLPSRY